LHGLRGQQRDYLREICVERLCEHFVLK
jgi:hypothetical protein